MISQIIKYLQSGEANVIIKKKDQKILEIDVDDDKIRTKILDFTDLIQMIDDVAPELMEFITDLLKKGYGFELK